jgi:hypothetical protein
MLAHYTAAYCHTVTQLKRIIGKRYEVVLTRAEESAVRLLGKAELQIVVSFCRVLTSPSTTLPEKGGALHLLLDSSAAGTTSTCEGPSIILGLPLP